MAALVALAVAISTLLLYSPGVALAQELAEKNWTEHAELSYASTNGNTDVSSLFFENTFKLDIKPSYLATWLARVENGKTDGATTAESYFTELRVDYNHTPRAYGFSMAGWFKDIFSGIDSRLYLGVGGGYRFITGTPHNLSAEAGLNIVGEKTTDGKKRNYLASRLLGRYEYVFTEKSRFTQTAEWIYDFGEPKNWQFVSVSAMTSKMNDHLSLKVSHTIEYDNQPVPGLRKTDTTTKASLVADF